MCRHGPRGPPASTRAGGGAADEGQGGEIDLSAAAHRRARWRGLAALVTAVMIAVGLAQTSSGHAVLRALGLFQEPPAYTSLSFQHPRSPLGRLKSRRADVALSFVIHNAGLTGRDYQWSVALGKNGLSRRLDAGRIGVAAGRGIVVTRNFPIFCSHGRVHIVVSLASPPESIGAWAACHVTGPKLR
jgi:hypothetical protein